MIDHLDPTVHIYFVALYKRSKIRSTSTFALINRRRTTAMEMEKQKQSTEEDLHIDKKQKEITEEDLHIDKKQKTENQQVFFKLVFSFYLQIFVYFSFNLKFIYDTQDEAAKAPRSLKKPRKNKQKLEKVLKLIIIVIFFLYFLFLILVISN